MINIKKASFDGDSNLGLHTEATDKFCLMDPTLSGKCREAVEDVLDVEVIGTTVAGSRMSGIFCAANSNGVVLPRNAETEEIETIRETGIRCETVDTKQTALGNLILVNDSACVVSERLVGAKEDLERIFDVPVRSASIAGRDLLGSSSVVTNKGLLSHRDITDEEIDVLEEIFGLECGRGTVNFGVPFVGACIVANKKGVLVSEKTTGPELGRIEEALVRNREV